MWHVTEECKHGYRCSSFFGTGSLVNGYGQGLGARESFVAQCRQAIPVIMAASCKQAIQDVSEITPPPSRQAKLYSRMQQLQSWRYASFTD